MSRPLLPALIGASVTAWGMPYVVLLLEIHRMCVEWGACSLTQSGFRYGPWVFLACAVISAVGPSLLARNGMPRLAIGMAALLALVGFLSGVVLMMLLTDV